MRDIRVPRASPLVLVRLGSVIVSGANQCYLLRLQIFGQECAEAVDGDRGSDFGKPGVFGETGDELGLRLLRAFGALALAAFPALGCGIGRKGALDLF